MRLVPDSGTVLMRGQPHWLRCAFRQAALVDDIVTLAPLDGADADDGQGGEPGGEPYTGGYAGMAFDQHCRLFHPVPEEARIEYVMWGKTSVLAVRDSAPHPFELSVADELPGETLPRQPLALACAQGYLYIADPLEPAVWLADTWQQEVARRIAMPAAPLDLAQAGDAVYALLEAAGGPDAPQQWLKVAPCAQPQALDWPAGVAGARRLAVLGDGRAFVLCRAGQADATVVCLQQPSLALAVAFCTDLAVAEEHAEFGALFVLARRPGDPFVRYRLQGRQWAPQTALSAPQYDGRGIALAPDGRIAYWTARGLRHAAPARTAYEEQGWLFGFALDSGLDQNRWGALTVEACIPEGTGILIHALTRDELDFSDPLPRTAPSGQAQAPIAQPELTPLPSTVEWLARREAGHPLFRIDSGGGAAGVDSLRPVLGTAPQEGYALYEAPVHAPPGRHLWLVFELRGTRSKTPRLRSARAAYPGHGLLRHLPRTLWRDPRAEDFLHRYLMPPAAMLEMWGAVSAQRQRLLNPHAAPPEWLDWLASFIGLGMQPCWPEAARRQMIAEGARLFRGRGTLWSLKRMLEILTGAQVLLLEKFRSRGGGVIGNPQATSSQAVLGVGFRVGGAIGGGGEFGAPAEFAPAAPVSAEPTLFDQYAHRFTITIVARLDAEQVKCARQLVEAHKPAHTLFDLCGADAGARVGVGLHVGLASVIGASSGFDQAIVGDAVLGKGYLLGRPALQKAASPQGEGPC
jgi:phage tail-like protein